jgi:hypothetical protein
MGTLQSTVCYWSTARKVQTLRSFAFLKIILCLLTLDDKVLTWLHISFFHFCYFISPRYDPQLTRNSKRINKILPADGETLLGNWSSSPRRVLTKLLRILLKSSFPQISHRTFSLPSSFHPLFNTQLLKGANKKAKRSYKLLLEVASRQTTPRGRMPEEVHKPQRRL